VSPFHPAIVARTLVASSARAAHAVRRHGTTFAALLVLALVAVTTVVMPTAQAKPVGAITGVTTTPATLPRTGTLTTNFTFCVPGGTAAGDTFTLTIPAMLTNIGSHLELDDPGSNPPQAIADGVRNGDVWTFTLTAYAAAHQNVCGSGHFTANFNGTEVNGDNTLTYTTNDGSSFTSHVNVTAGPVVDRSKPYKVGKFNTSTDQCRSDGDACITWSVQSEVGPLTSGTLTDTLNSVNVAAETLNCPTLATARIVVGTPTSSAPFISNTSPYSGTTAFSCSSSGFSWSFGAVPAGQIVQLSLTANTAENSAGNVPFQNTVSGVSNVHPTPQSTTTFIRSGSLGGQANGDNVEITKWSTADGATAGAFDTAPGKPVATNTPTPITMTIKNTGSTSLTGITVSDVTTSGAILTGLTCDFSQAVVTAPTSGVTWAGPMPAGTSFPCTGTIGGMAAGTQETDTATVVATGNGPVTSSNPFNSFTPAAPIVAVGDYVWTDTNHNGIQDAGETPVPGVTVTLLNADGTPALDYNGNPVPSTTTDAAGHYVFDDLAPGTYEVKFSNLPPGYSFTTQNSTGSTSANDSNPNPNTGITPPFTVAPGSPDTRPVQPGDGTHAAAFINPTIDAGLIAPTYAVGDYVWKDTNSNGIQDAGEQPVAGVTVTLLNADGTPAKNADGTPVAAIQTDANGHYVFDNLGPGTYEVQFSNLPPGYSFTTQNSTGSTSANDSNPNPSTGITPPFTLGPNAPNMRPVTAADGTTMAYLINPTIDAGIVLTPTIKTGVGGSTPPISSPGGPGRPLAYTGVDSLSLVGLGSVLVALGVLALVIGSGRRRGESHS
jgi:protocatechuate 3,4-dioxygenase beta subunit